MKLTNIRFIGRYKSPEGKQVNIYKGRKVGYSIDVLYYTYRGIRILVSDAKFQKWSQIVNESPERQKDVTT